MMMTSNHSEAIDGLLHQVSVRQSDNRVQASCQVLRIGMKNLLGWICVQNYHEQATIFVFIHCGTFYRLTLQITLNCG